MLEWAAGQSSPNIRSKCYMCNRINICAHGVAYLRSEQHICANVTQCSVGRFKATVRVLPCFASGHDVNDGTWLPDDGSSAVVNVGPVVSAATVSQGSQSAVRCWAAGGSLAACRPQLQPCCRPAVGCEFGASLALNWGSTGAVLLLYCHPELP
jgi:hypothetical protein